MIRIYAVSKIRHIKMWKELRATGLPIISTWIDDGAEEDIRFAEAWPRYLKEAASATHVLVFLAPGDFLKGGLFEIGAALGGGARVILVSQEVIPQMRTLIHHPAVMMVDTIDEALAWIRADVVLVGRPGERDPEFPCEDFKVEEGLVPILRSCEGDGHYLCGECVHHRETVN
jgi:hypothetical protein